MEIQKTDFDININTALKKIFDKDRLPCMSVVLEPKETLALEVLLEYFVDSKNTDIAQKVVKEILDEAR